MGSVETRVQPFCASSVRWWQVCGFSQHGHDPSPQWLTQEDAQRCWCSMALETSSYTYVHNVMSHSRAMQKTASQTRP